MAPERGTARGLHPSALLFDVTSLGMTVIITSVPAVPSAAEAPGVAVSGIVTGERPLEMAPYEWHPERATDGIVSVVVSAADQRAVVFRDGLAIGSAPVRVDGPVGSGMAYVLHGTHWWGKGVNCELPTPNSQLPTPNANRSRAV